MVVVVGRVVVGRWVQGVCQEAVVVLGVVEGRSVQGVCQEGVVGFWLAVRLNSPQVFWVDGPPWADRIDGY